MPLQGNLSVARMCKLADVSRAGFYRFLLQEWPAEEEMEVRSVIQQIVLEHKRRYGYRRVKKELKSRGLVVNHKRVLRLMQEDNLLAVQPRAFVATTDSNHEFQAYLNLAARMQLTGINQLWVADITYIRLRREFVYLAVILDAYSRKVVGWELSRRLNAELCLGALRKAIVERRPAAGLVHHSDRGIQYASRDYVQLLGQYGILSSMSRPANPYDNATCESFLKTLKYEEIYCQQVSDLEELRRQVEIFIEQYYNCRRLHSALDYRSPEQFEREQEAAATFSQAAQVSFSGHGEIYQCNGEQPASHSPTHCLDESPAGYSSAGCSPAEPACASPAGADDARKEEVKQENVIKQQSVMIATVSDEGCTPLLSLRLPLAVTMTYF
ncbi:MAG TPA: IS3 family transposase [Candidatus Angelobacter sp.]